MTATTREQIWQAMFAKLQTLGGIATFSRRAIINESTTALPPVDQPAIWLMEGDEERIRNPGSRVQKPKIVMTGEIWLWMKLPDASGGNGSYVPDLVTPGASLLNPFLDAIDALFNQDDDAMGGVTLGGLVEHCWCEGRGIKVPGDLDPSGQCFSSVPIKILWP